MLGTILEKQALILNRTHLRSTCSSVFRLAAYLCIVTLAGCGTLPVARVDGHLKAEPRETGAAKATPAAGRVPEPVRQIPLPPPPMARLEEIRYSVTVKDVPVEELLFAISRDTKVNIDVHPGIEGRVTLNAIDQTLKQILNRISKQADVRYETDGPNLVVMKDSPYLKLYRVDYVNMTRDSTSSIGVQTQVVGPSNISNTGSTNTGQNTTQLRIDNASKNRFWESLEKNIKDLLRETDKELPEGSTETFVQSRGADRSASTQAKSRTQKRSSTTTANTQSTTPGVTQIEQQSESFEQRLTFREAASVIVNPETGTVSVRATSRQQERVAEFISQVSGSASRQVLIEATVVEITLNDDYQGGVDWSALGLQGLGYTFRQSLLGAATVDADITAGKPFFSAQYKNPNAAVGGSISSTIKLLSSFGNTRVLSSPRITAMNNQTAVMKVVENRVYFTVKAEVTAVAATGATASTTLVSYTSTPNVVPEGFVLNVTPQISDGDVVTLNIRPSITRIVNFRQDPNPDLARAGVKNSVPEIQTREFETVMRVPSGMTAVLGGLMQDEFSAKRDGLPIVSRIPVLGDAASFRNDNGRKTELFVFLRPVVIKDASIDTDYAAYRKNLPDGQFFKEAEPVIPGPLPGSAPRKSP
jgi:MSHA biogenesis protein MshL